MDCTIDSNYSKKEERNVGPRECIFILSLPTCAAALMGGSSPVKLTFLLLCPESEKVKMRTFKADEINIQAR